MDAVERMMYLAVGNDIPKEVMKTFYLWKNEIKNDKLNEMQKFVEHCNKSFEKLRGNFLANSGKAFM